MTKLKNEYFKGKDDNKVLIRTLLKEKIRGAELAQDIILTRFLESNSRKDRDSLLRKREQIITYKTILKNELFQQNS